MIDRIEAGYLDRSPSGGIHWLYRCAIIAGNTELARYLSDEIEASTGNPKIKPLIETRGEGGYIICAPTNGTVHPTLGVYELLRGGFGTIATITPEEREALWNPARSFDRMPEPEPHDPAERQSRQAQPGSWDDAVSPIDDYNDRTAWSDILPHGWTMVYRQSETEYWRRPGKNRGVSATISRNGLDRLYVFSSSGEELETQKPYTKFAAYARLRHGGDFKATVAALSQAGSGTFKAWVKEESGWVLRTLPNPCPSGGKVRIAKPGEPPPIDFEGFGKSEPKPEGTATAPDEPEPWQPIRLGELPSVPSFPLDVLPEDIAQFVTEAAGAVGCDPGLVAGPLLATAGGLIGRSASLQLGSNWFAQPCLFQASVALPGDGKSPCLDYATAPVRDIDRGLAEAFEVEKEVYRSAVDDFELAKKQKNAPSSRPRPPVPRRVYVDDTTLEAAFRVLSGNPRGLLMIRDELSALVLGLNQYKGGGGSDRPNLLKVWSGKSVLIDRVLNEFGEPIRIPHPLLCITGNLPPGMLVEMVNRRGDDGLIDRWLFVYPDRRPKLKSSQRRPVRNEAVRRPERRGEESLGSSDGPE